MYMRGNYTDISSKQILRLAAPISLALLIPQISFFTNTVFLGRLGERELGVNGITGVFYLILSMIGYGLSSGMQIQMARRAGEGNNRGMAHLLTNGAMLALLFALGLMVLTLWVSPFIFSFSLKDFDNLSLCVNFVYIRVWGLPFLMLTQLLSSFFISIGKSRLLIFGSLVATFLNIFFDYGLIFGKMGMPAMGFMGAATASVISEIFYFLAMVAIFLYHRFYRTYPIADYLNFDVDLSAKSLSVAAPLIVQFMFSIGGWLIFFIFIEHLGKDALAASQVLRNTFGIIGVGTWALATTCNTLVSNVIGRGKSREVIPLVLKICKLSIGYTAIVCLGLALCSKGFLGIYTSDASLIAFAIPSLYVIIAATLVMAVSTVVFNGVVGTGNTLVNLSMEITCVGCYLGYCYFVIWQWHSELYLCWGSEFVYWTTLLVGSTLYLRSGRWKGKEI